MGEHEPKGPGEGAVTDWILAARLIPGGPEGVVRLARMMAMECPRMLDGIRLGLDGDDGEAARISAHSLQGGARYFGAAEVAERAHAIERQAEAGRLDDARHGVDALTRAVTRLVAVLAAVEADEIQRAVDQSDGHTT